MLHRVFSGLRSAFLLLVAVSVGTVLLCLIKPPDTYQHQLTLKLGVPVPVASSHGSGSACLPSPPPPPSPPIPLHSLFAGQCEYSFTEPGTPRIPRITTLTGGKRNPLFVYDTTLQFEYGGGGEGMAYFVGFLEAETPKYQDGGNHGVGAGLSAAAELFANNQFQCHWVAPRTPTPTPTQTQTQTQTPAHPSTTDTDTDTTTTTHSQHHYTPVAWYLNGDTSTFSFYCRIPASIGWVSLSAIDSSSGSPLLLPVSLSLENPLFVGPSPPPSPSPSQSESASASASHALHIPLCQRSHTFHKISVCTQPLHAPITPEELKQWMEYHYMLGVDNFYIYDRDGSFATMLKPYERAGLATRYHFPLLTPGMTHKWYDQPQAMHVCLHRHRYTSRWIFFLDVDEYLHSDKWTQPAPHVAHLLSRYSEAPLAHYTHLIVWKRTAIPRQRDAPWDPKTMLLLQHADKYGKAQRVAVKFALRPWDGRTLSIHSPNSFVVFNSKEMDVDPHDMVITHMKPYNTLNNDELDTNALPPHPWILQRLTAAIHHSTYQGHPHTGGVGPGGQAEGEREER